MQAMILAAGLGTRLRPYSERRPKPLFPVLGRPLVLHLLDQLRRYGCQATVVNSHFLSEHFCSLLGEERDVRLQVEEKILGTGGGLRKALPLLGEKAVLVVNGDVIHSLDLGEIYRRHLASPDPVSMVVHDRPRFNNLLVDGAGKVRGLRVGQREGGAGSGCSLRAFTGIQVVDPAVLGGISAGHFSDIIDFYREMLAGGGTINAIEVSGHFWTDVGTPEDYLDLHMRLLTEPSLAKSLGMTDPGRPVYIGEGVKLGRNVALADWAWVGGGATIGSGVRICRSVIWEGAVVPEGAVVEDEIFV